MGLIEQTIACGSNLVAVSNVDFCESLYFAACEPVLRVNRGMDVRVSSCAALSALIGTIVRTPRKAIEYCTERLVILYRGETQYSFLKGVPQGHCVG